MLEGPCVQPASLVPHLPLYEGVFSSMFMHAGWVHIAGNMLFLWIFGNNVEDSIGRARFLIWYLAAGLTAAAAQTFVTLAFAGDAGASIPNIGASGAIAGVLGAYFVLLPRASVLTAFFFIFLREIPAMWFLGIWFLLELWDGGFAVLHPQAGGGTAFFAHVGGFVFGVVTIRFVSQRRPCSQPGDELRRAHLDRGRGRNRRPRSPRDLPARPPGLRNASGGKIVLPSMKTMADIHTELDRATERRSELWHLLSNGHDAALSNELHELEERIAALWDEQRTLKAQQRFGDRDEIIKRARHEERLARAA